MGYKKNRGFKNPLFHDGCGIAYLVKMVSVAIFLLRYECNNTAARHDLLGAIASL
jgi:hypothetical protein